VALGSDVKAIHEKEGQVVPIKIARVLAFGGTLAVCLSASAPTASAGSRSAAEDRTVFRPIQSIRYDFGSKSMSGYFVEQASACHVMLMVSEATNPDTSPQPSGARVRLVLAPGEIAALDSEEGRSLNFTCGDGGRTLLVHEGETGGLVKLQAHRETVTQ
jgi:hypothetical protein